MSRHSEKHGHHHHDEDVGVTETIQSLVVAFVLAMIFRGFVIEGFVIPTGSMAPTLMGQHMLVRSEQSGYEYPAGVVEGVGLNGEIVLPDPMVSPELGAGTLGSMTNGRARMGDRILVIKNLYTFWDPDRFDVIVFKNPNDPNGPAGNYIKRLLGLPYEAVWLADGDVFTRDTRDDGSTFAIARKPEHVQRAVWQPVYNSDYVPLNADSLIVGPLRRQYQGSPWTGADWQLGGSRVLKTEVSSATTLQWRSDWWPIEDYASYNGIDHEAGGMFRALESNGLEEEESPVSDLRVAAAIRPLEDGFTTTFELRARNHVFEYTLSPDAATIRYRHEDARDWEDSKSADISAFDAGSVTNVEFWHVDQAMRLYIDGDEVLSIEYDWAPEARLRYTHGEEDSTEMPLNTIVHDYIAPDPMLTWNFEGSPVEMRRVRVDRDLFYKDRDAIRGRWAIGSTIRGPKELDADQFFMLGDNSPRSSDSRFWGGVHPMVATQIDATPNVVHRKMLIGKAWVVYFPAPLPINDGPKSLIPDFGRLRFIR